MVTSPPFPSSLPASRLPPRPGRPGRFQGRWVALLALPLLGLGGCKAWRVETAPPAQVLAEQHPEVIRVTRVSDTARVIMHAPRIEGDSLRGLPTELSINDVAVAVSDVASVAIRRTSLGKTMLAVLGIAGAVAVYELLMSLNQTSF